jgi:glycosyltransferase involved in cell wall biosynthesis
MEDDSVDQTAMIAQRCRSPEERPSMTVSDTAPKIAVTLLTGGIDKHYTFGLTTALLSEGAVLDLIGSDELDGSEFHNDPRLTFLNLRGDQQPNAGFFAKASRVLKYYLKLIHYAATAKPRIFHILWNNRFETLDRTLLMLYYRFLGKRIVLTAHNVNAGRRDCKDTFLNRLTLRIQYLLADHIFVHTQRMKLELLVEFGVQGAQVTVIPYGINNAVPNTHLTPAEARQRLGIQNSEKTILFFGRITPYKGLEYLLPAFQQMLARRDDYRLIIAGRPDSSENYWGTIQEQLREFVHSGRVLLKSEFIPDDQTEVYFKAADALVLPYRHIYQSGILFLGYSFGLPVLAADVGSLKDEIVEGKTGFVFRPADPADMARTIERYFASDLFANLSSRRPQIQDYVKERHSWQTVGQVTMEIYTSLLRFPPLGPLPNCNQLSSKAFQERH